MKNNIDKLKDKKDVKKLIKALNDLDFGYAQSAAKALCELGDSRALEPLLRYLRDRGFFSESILINAIEKNEGINIREKDYTNVYKCGKGFDSRLSQRQAIPCQECRRKNDRQNRKPDDSLFTAGAEG
jgi:hypothetical protein